MSPLTLQQELRQYWKPSRPVQGKHQSYIRGVKYVKEKASLVKQYLLDICEVAEVSGVSHCIDLSAEHHCTSSQRVHLCFG